MYIPYLVYSTHIQPNTHIQPSAYVYIQSLIYLLIRITCTILIHMHNNVYMNSVSILRINIKILLAIVQQYYSIRYILAIIIL